MPPAPYSRLMTRQGASVFNQPLSFDTSSVPSMRLMLSVRSARAPNLQSGLALHVACSTSAPRPLASRLAPRPASHVHAVALLSTRQHAVVFNQPLNLDTSSVTDMEWMFAVRSAPAL